MRKSVLLLLLCLWAPCVFAQEPEKVFSPPQFFSLPEDITPEYIDTVTVPKLKLNDYWMVGVFGGVSLEKGFFVHQKVVFPSFKECLCQQLALSFPYTT